MKSILPDVDVEIIDGGMGTNSDTVTGIGFKIGVCSLGQVGEIYSFSNPDKVIEILGSGPMVNAILDALQEGAQVVRAVKAAGSVAGTKSAVTKTGTGTATAALSGEPLDSYEVVIEIVKAGALNAAQYKVSLDGGDTFSDKATVPANGEVALSGTGLTLTFTAGDPANSSFVIGDKYSFATEAPQMANADLLAALTVIKNSNYEYEFIHVVGEATPAIWILCSTEASALEQNHIYVHFICEARNKDANETVDQYVNALVADAADFSSTRVSVVAARCEAVTLDGKQKDANGAGIYSGILAKSKVCESPGKVAEYKTTAALRLLPLGINQAHIQALDAARYITFRQYQGLRGIYVTNGRMMAPSASDYQFVETRRTADKASREVRKRGLLLEHSEINMEELGALENFLQVPLDTMANDTVKEIADYRLVVPKGQNVLSTSTLEVELSIVPLPIMRWLTIKQRMNNPYLRK